MADGNPNPNQKNDTQNKSGLSWTQAGQNTQNKNANTNSTKPITTPTNYNTNKLHTESTDSTGRVISIIIGIVVVFALAAWGIVALHNRSNLAESAYGTDIATSTATATTTDSAVTGATDLSETKPLTNSTSPQNAGVASGATASFTVPTQDAGTSVAFSGLSVSEPTWLIVYEMLNGTPGRILGANMFFKGDTEGKVELLRETMPGKSYAMSAAVDNGDHTFNLHDDKMVPDANGGQMWIKFQTR